MIDGRKLDNSFLRLIHPLKVGLLGLAVYGILFVVSPLVVDIQFSAGGVIYFALGYLAFFAGGWFTSVLPNKPQGSTAVMGINVQRLFRFVSIAAIFGLFLRVVDRFFVRNVSLVQNVIERREALEAGGSNFFSTLSAALYPFSLLTLFYYFLLCRSDGKRHPFALLIASITFAIPSLDATMLGSRSTVLVSVSLMCLYLLYFRILRFTIQHVSAILTSAILLFLFSSWIFLDRLAGMGLDALFSIMQSGYAFTVQPEAWIVNLLNETTSDLTFMASFTYLNASQYYLHGLFEFFYLYDNFDWTYGHSGGSFTFFALFKLFHQIFGNGMSADHVLSLQPRPGVYTTFFGPIFVDYGWFGLIPIFLFGLISSAIWKASMAGNILAIPPLLYLNIVILFMPVVSLIQSAGGVYILVALLGYYWIGNKFFVRNIDI